MPTPAIAGAWIAPPDGQEIWTNVAGQRGDLEYFETFAYWEIPLAERTAFVATPWVEQAADSSDDGWRAEATLGVKRALMRTDHAAMAVQAGAVWTSEPTGVCGEAAAELRWLGGVNLGAHGFVNLEAAAPRARMIAPVAVSISPLAIAPANTGSAWRSCLSTTQAGAIPR